MNDDLLDSLTRQAELIERQEEMRSLELETLLEVGPSDQMIQPPDFPSPRILYHSKLRHLDKEVFAVMLIGGLTFLWVYSRLSETLDLQSLAMLRQ